jgi:hypothetical protein
MTKKSTTAVASAESGEQEKRRNHARYAPTPHRRPSRRSRHLMRGFVWVGDQTIICESMKQLKAVKAELGLSKVA